MRNPNEGYDKDFALLADIALRKGEPEEALKAYEKGGMTRNKALEKMGDIFFEGRNYPDAIDYYERAGDKIKAKVIKAHKKFGDGLLSDGEYTYAKEEYELAGINNKIICKKIGIKLWKMVIMEMLLNIMRKRD